MRCMPALSCTTGSCCATAGSAASIRRTKRINEKGRETPALFFITALLLLLALALGLLLHLLGRLGSLVARRLGLRLRLLGRLRLRVLVHAPGLRHGRRAS